MSKLPARRISAEVDGFTPIFDTLAKADGLVTAAVFGRVWRYCQMEDGVCRASLTTIGAGLKLDRATVLRHIQKLEGKGYLRDTTPSLRNAPHTYADTGKLKMSIGVTVAHNNSAVADNNRGVAHNNATVAESYLNKSTEETYQETLKEREGAPRPARPAPLDLNSVVPATLKNQKAPQQKRKRKSRHDPDPSSRNASVKIYRRRYPKVKLSRDETRLIAHTFTDLDAWQQVLDVWRWRPRNWTDMKERYEDTITIRDNPPPKAQMAKPQPQQFGVGGELYRAAVAAGFDLSDLREAEHGN